MEQVIDVASLRVPTLTRARGREAYRALRERWHEASVALVLDGVQMLSLSFLDGMVLELLAAGESHRVTFVTSNPATQQKLTRVAGLHPEALLYTREIPDGERHRVARAPIEMEQAEFEPIKGEVADPGAYSWSARTR